MDEELQRLTDERERARATEDRLCRLYNKHAACRGPMNAQQERKRQRLRERWADSCDQLTKAEREYRYYWEAVSAFQVQDMHAQHHTDAVNLMQAAFPMSQPQAHH